MTAKELLNEYALSMSKSIHTREIAGRCLEIFNQKHSDILLGTEQENLMRDFFLHQENKMEEVLVLDIIRDVMILCSFISGCSAGTIHRF